MKEKGSQKAKPSENTWKLFTQREINNILNTRIPITKRRRIVHKAIARGKPK